MRTIFETTLPLLGEITDTVGVLGAPSASELPSASALRKLASVSELQSASMLQSVSASRFVSVSMSVMASASQPIAHCYADHCRRSWLPAAS